jgi:hypothetical protein
MTSAARESKNPQDISKIRFIALSLGLSHGASKWPSRFSTIEVVVAGYFTRDRPRRWRARSRRAPRVSNRPTDSTGIGKTVIEPD